MLKKFSIVSAFGLIVILPAAFATVLAPGVTAPPDVITSPTSSYTIVSTTSGNINPVPGTSFNASYTEYVTRDSSNVFGAGDLTYLLAVNNAGPGIIERVSSSAFDGFSTDVGYNANFGSGILPSTVDRSTNGNVVGFNFIPPGTNIGAGAGSIMLVIETNSTVNVPGFISIQDGQAGTGAGNQPSSSVPEPVSMSLLGGGLAVLGLARWRRSAKRA